MSSLISTSVRPLNRLSLVDRDLSQIDWERIACSIFACGSEARSLAVFGQVSGSIDRMSIVLGFDGPIGMSVPEEHKRRFLDRVSPEQFFIPSGDISVLIERIVGIIGRAPKGADTILLDISSMPRAWYLGIIMWFRFSDYADTYKMLLAYAGGSYAAAYPERQIMDLRRVVGTGGYYDASQPVTAILSLGFDGGAAHAATERIEPDHTIAIISETPGFEESRERALRTNGDFLEHADRIIYLPHLSFAQPYRAVCEMIAPLSDRNIVCVPLGPKTHIVALALAGLMFPRAISLHVVSRYNRPFLVNPNGRFCFAELSVIFEMSVQEH